MMIISYSAENGKSIFYANFMMVALDSDLWLVPQNFFDFPISTCGKLECFARYIFCGQG
jgi:hypothetical protein